MTGEAQDTSAATATARDGPPNSGTCGGAAEERVLSRAEELNLDDHLLLGLTVDAMEGWISHLPPDAIEQCDEEWRHKDGTLNGYICSWHIERWSKENGGKSYCEALRERGDPGVGIATVFVSWSLQTPLATLVDALRQYLIRHPDLPPDTKFRVSHFVMRHPVPDEDLWRLVDCVRAVGHTVLLMDPWQAPQSLRRAYCLLETYHTKASGGRFDVVMSKEQQAAFEAALVEDFDSIKDSIETSLIKVDVRRAECHNPDERDRILEELRKEDDLAECNKAVHALLRGELPKQGKAALERMAPAERRTSALIIQLGTLLYDHGDLDGAEALYREALKARRETLGNRHRETLTLVDDLSRLLQAKGNLDGAEPLYREALEAKREKLGDTHPRTLIAINNLGTLLHHQGDLDGAKTLLHESLKSRREMLGDRHSDTLTSMNNLESLLRTRETSQRMLGCPNAAQEEDGDVPGCPAAVAFDFIFSNKTESDELCLEIRDKLTSHGVTVWQQRTNIPKDPDNWFNEWYPSAVKARKIVCFLTTEYLKSTYCMREFGIALNTNRLLVVACEPTEDISKVDESDYPHASNALAYLICGGQVIFHHSDDVIAEILNFAASSHDEEARAHPDLCPVDKNQLINGGQVIFHASKDMVDKTLGKGRPTEAFDFVFSNKTESDTMCLQIRDKIMSHGVTIWQQRTNIPKDSDSWFDEWFRSARKARKIVCFLTADYLKSPHCMKEFKIAINTNKLLAVACEPFAKINEVDPSAHPRASEALAYLINNGREVIMHDSEDVVAEILKFATNPGEANPNDAEAEARPEPRPVEDLTGGGDGMSKTHEGGRKRILRTLTTFRHRSL